MLSLKPVPMCRLGRMGVSAVAALLLLASLPAAAELTFVDVTAEKFPDGIAASYYLWSDCDGDGDEDLLVGSKTIYINGGAPDFIFTKKTDTGDLAAAPHSVAQWIDINNDGYPDIFGIGGGDNERLFLNDGTCSFTDISDFDGDGTPDLGDASPSTTVSVGDYDADGFLDVFVGNYERHCGGDPTVCADCLTDRLWHNLGNNTFENVYTSLGMEATEHASAGYCVNAETPCDTDADCPPYPQDNCKIGMCARSSAWVDYNNDGYLDLYVGNYRLDPNFLWENDGNGGFTQVSYLRNADGSDEGDGIWGHTLGVDWADFDNDGDMDVYIANLTHWWGAAAGHDACELRENSGEPDFAFADIRPSSGMRQHDPGSFSDWSEFTPTWGDYDLDGDLDIYTTQGYSTWDTNFSSLYSNNGDKTFTETTTAHGADLGLYQDYSAAWCDFDQDGDLDLITYGASAPENAPREAHLFRNDGANQNDWLQVQLRGSGAGGSNSFGVGARITATRTGISQIREVQGGHGYHAERNSLVQTFGFGAATGNPVDSLSIRWTTRSTEDFFDVPVGIRYTAWEAGTIQRGTDPSSPLPDLAGALMPYHDPVLDDGVTYFYEVSGIDDQTLMVDKDGTGGYVVLSFQ